jgi:hypothetical protein
MNKAEQREVQKAVNTAKSAPHYAAATLACVMRSATKKTFLELVAVMNDLGLRDHMEVVNGCYVAKEPVAA